MSAMLAPTPPMGWNSWNSFATTLDETQALETARIMAEKLLPFGYEYFTIDAQWFEPAASGYTYSTKPQVVMDEWGRLTPTLNRFPSAADGVGLAEIGRRVHALGLKFGLHQMRGIPRLAVERNLPVLGTNVRAGDIADTTSICSWNPDMYGIDMRKPGAQAYYDSVFALFASWGVDLVKVDDMSRPYDAHAPEIEAVHAAIAKTGRPMILSLSPGETPVIRADHVSRYAQMWRISDDFWDEWPQLEAQFVRLENWNPVRREGAWPDPDMLPLGRISLGTRDSRFTPDEQRSVMTLWAITRSPLIMGGDLRHLDAATLALLTNREVIEVDQHSTDNRPHFEEDRTRLWSARDPKTDDRYLALFNTGAKEKEVGLPLDRLGLKSIAGVRDLWSGTDMAPPSQPRVSVLLPPHGSALLRLKVRA